MLKGVLSELVLLVVVSCRYFEAMSAKCSEMFVKPQLKVYSISTQKCCQKIDRMFNRTFAQMFSEYLLKMFEKQRTEMAVYGY